MYDYDVFSVESKAEVLEKSREFWNPGKTDFWSETEGRAPQRLHGRLPRLAGPRP